MSLHKTPPRQQVVQEVEIDQVSVNYIIRQDPISVTLDGPTVFALALALVLVIHFVEPRVAEATVALTPLLLAIRNDYNNFLNLGPGGTPATVQGYVRIAWLRLWALRDPLVPPKPDPTRLRLPKSGILSREPLPYRPGPRPVVAGIAPQRQLDQHGNEGSYMALRHTLEQLSVSNPTKFGNARSCFEKHGLGLFALHPVNKTCQGEICHVHPSDHSLHMNLHPDDIRELLEKGWGQRHPLAWKAWFVLMPVPENFVMVYSPRDEYELRVVCRIIEAAAWFVTGEEAKIEVYGTPLKPVAGHGCLL